METSILSGMCRCCALEGTFKDLKCTYHWMGEQEVYGDMLRECFNIDLSAEDGIDGGICEVCITQLRNAANFKKQVLYTEDQFKKRLQNKFFKASLVKVELPADDGPDSDDNENNLSEDEAFSNIEYEVPIKKEELDEPKPKKRAAKATTSRAKKAKADVGETSKRKPSSTGLGLGVNDASTLDENFIESVKEPAEVSMTDDDVINDIDSIYLENQDNEEVTNMDALMAIRPPEKEIRKHLHNIDTLLSYTNATLIKQYTIGLGYYCIYCPNNYKNPLHLKSHVLEEHPYSERSKFPRKVQYLLTSFAFLAKVDVTSLVCLICDEPMVSLDEVLEHLKSHHNKTIYTDIKNQIVPFSFGEDKLKCIVCAQDFLTFNLLVIHMAVHYANFPCPKCDKPFITFSTLKLHWKIHDVGEFLCSYCFKAYDTVTSKNAHEKHMHSSRRRQIKCTFCKEVFATFYSRLDHMVEKHGAEPVTVKCDWCDATYKRKKTLQEHIRNKHMMERNYSCVNCNKKFFSKVCLQKHMLIYTSERNYHCYVCTKAFKTSNALKKHMRIHTNDRRYTCEYCDAQFIHQVTWKSHLKAAHGKTYKSK